MPVTTTWGSPTTLQTDWRKDFTTGRHTYGASIVSGLRIVFGDFVRYGGTANLAEKTTAWGGISSNVIIWT